MYILCVELEIVTTYIVVCDDKAVCLYDDQNDMLMRPGCNSKSLCVMFEADLPERIKPLQT